MDFNTIITIVLLLGAFILFITEVLSVDLVALLIMAAFVLFGVITPEEGISGFSNKATITVFTKCCSLKNGGFTSISPTTFFYF